MGIHRRTVFKALSWEGWHVYFGIDGDIRLHFSAFDTRGDVLGFFEWEEADHYGDGAGLIDMAGGDGLSDLTS